MVYFYICIPLLENKFSSYNLLQLLRRQGELTPLSSVKLIDREVLHRFLSGEIV